MAIKLVDEYPGRAEPASADYPGGSFRNETDGANDGTPWEAAWIKDRDGLPQALLKKTNHEANGVVDTAETSQYFDALMELTKTLTVDPAVDYKDMCSGYRTNGWSDMSANPNVLDTTATIYDSCLSWDHSAQKPCLYVCTSDAEILKIDGCWNYTGNPTAGAVTLSASLGTIANIYSLCSDGDYLYAAYIAGGYCKISKFALAVWTGEAIWTVDTGRTDAGTTPATTVINASETHIGLLVGNTGDTTVWTAGSIRKSDGNALYGIGNTPAGGTLAPHMFKMASDGTTLYWVGYTTANNHVFSATIADPTTSPYSILNYGNSQADSRFRGIAWAEDKLIIARADGATLAFFPSVNSFGGCISSADSHFALSNPTPDATDCDALVGFDGISVWFAHCYFGATGAMGLRAIPASAYSVERTASAVASPPPSFAKATMAGYTALPAGRLLHDKRDLWLVLVSGSIHRITAPFSRC